MNLTGRQFMVVLMMVVVASVTTFAQDTKVSLKAKLKEVWPEKTDYDRNIWDLIQQDVVSVDIPQDNEHKGIVFNLDFGYRTTGYVENSFSCFDSDIYQQMFPDAKAVPQVKGTVFWVQSNYDPNDIYIVIVWDNAILNSIVKKFDQTDKEGRRYHTIDFKTGATGDEALDVMGNMKYTYTGKDGKDYTFIPTLKGMVMAFNVTHPIGSFLQTYTDQKFGGIYVNTLNTNSERIAPVANSFSDAYLMPVQATAMFDSEQTKYGFVIFRQNNGEFLFVSVPTIKKLMQ